MDELGEPGITAHVGSMVCLKVPLSVQIRTRPFAGAPLPFQSYQSHLRFLPLIPFSQSPVVSIPSSVAAGKASSLALLSTLESHLDGRTYLVGTYLTLADIMVAMYVSRGLEWVLGREWREGHARVMNHFQTVAAWECVSAIVPSFKMVEEEG